MRVVISSFRNVEQRDWISERPGRKTGLGNKVHAIICIQKEHAERRRVRLNKDPGI